VRLSCSNRPTFPIARYLIYIRDAAGVRKHRPRMEKSDWKRHKLLFSTKLTDQIYYNNTKNSLTSLCSVWSARCPFLGGGTDNILLTCIYMCIYIYIYTHIYILIYIYTHVGPRGFFFEFHPVIFPANISRRGPNVY